MRLTITTIAGISLALCSCGRAAEQPANDASAPTLNETVPPAPQAASANETQAEDRTPLAEPKGPIDPKSMEAAGQVVQHYGALIEQRRFAEAEKLWGSADAAAQFTQQLKRYCEAHIEIGKPGDSEGAAGSIYVTVSVVLYGKHQNAVGFRRPADVILRRVNDVPGSTEEQRRWHIERIDWKEG
jgi:hypothetical protein